MPASDIRLMGYKPKGSLSDSKRRGSGMERKAMRDGGERHVRNGKRRKANKDDLKDAFITSSRGQG